jgi:hypothetical protein
MTASTRSRRAFFAIAVALGAPFAAGAVACGSSSPPIASGGDTDSGSTPKKDGSTPTKDTGTTGDDGATPTDGAPTADSTPANDAAPPPPLCNPTASVGTPALVLSTPDPDLLGAVSADELVIAWTSLPSGGAPVVHWAERTKATDTFGAAQTLDAAFGPFAAEHVAMSGDGLKLLVVSDDHARVVEVTRAARGAPFDTLGDDFRDANPRDGGDGVAPGIGPFGSPALSGDLLFWGFTHGADGLTFAQNAGGAWNVLVPFPSGLVPPGSGAATMIATGWAADDRTFFYWDTTASKARAVWRDPTSGAFTTTKEYGAQQFASPAGSCAQLYFSFAGAGGDLDLFVAPLQ